MIKITVKFTYRQRFLLHKNYLNVHFHYLEIRLHGLDKPNEGRIEVYFEGAWGTVCDDIWDENIMNGKVACQQLGYSDVSLIFNSSHTPSGNIPNNLDNVDCIGNENKLFECRHVRGQDSDCDSSEDVGIKCKTGTVKCQI